MHELRPPSVSLVRRAVQNGLHNNQDTNRTSDTELSESNHSFSSTSVYSRNVSQNMNPSQNEMSFGEKKWLWVPDDKEGYIAGYITQELSSDKVKVHLVNGKDVQVDPNIAEKVNPPKFDRKEDMAELGYLNEASVVHNLKQRYAQGLIYTYSGPFLVAVNPYYNLKIYGPEIISFYRNKRRDEAQPHIYSIADAAYQAILHSRENQSILITGESGAGKTENTKIVINYLTSVAHSTQNQRDAGNNLEKQILSTNPILESFGNAQTIRNNNSSRFGKFIRIEFNMSGGISGANIEWYLLEKLRVTKQSQHERNFHIFYQFLKGASEDIKQKLLIDGGVSDYTFTKNCLHTINGVDDKANFGLLEEALTSACFEKNEIMDLYRIIASILHMGNIQLQATRGEEAILKDQLAAEKLCHVLGISLGDFTKALLRPRIKAGRDWVTQSRNVDQVSFSIAALARGFYERMFGSIVQKINSSMNRVVSSSSTSFIGVLDIAGFEILEVNSFEQLCINYTNEKLQQFFNHHMFILEQEEYRQEGIEWDFIDFGLDLQPTIDLIVKSQPIGILSCLDEDCVMPKSTDKSFTEKLHSLWAGKSSKYEKPRFRMGFIIKHYASQVEYDTTGWIEKNRDPLNESVARLLTKSSESYVANLFSDYSEDNDSRTSIYSNTSYKSLQGRSAFRTVGQRHKEQLNSLMTQLNNTEPHFVRCIVPNQEKMAGKIDTPLVLEQLRCNGVLEGIRITRQGFPNREPFKEFRQRYEILAPDAIPHNEFVDSKQAVQLLLKTMGIDPSKYKLGNSKVFFKAGELAALEEQRDIKLTRIITLFQAIARGELCRKRFKRRIDQAKAVRVIQRNVRSYNQLCEWPWWKMYLKIKPSLHFIRAEEEIRQRDELIIELQEKAELERSEKEIAERKLKEWDQKREDLERVLTEERNSALDQELILKRSKDREMELEEALKEQTATVEKLAEETEELSNQKELLESQIIELKEQLENETTSNRELANVSEDNINQLGVLERMVQEHKERADTASILHKDATMLVAELENQLLDFKNNESNLKEEAQSLNSRIQDLENDLKETKDAYNDALNTIENQKSAIESYLAKIENVQKQVAEEEEKRKIESQLFQEAKAASASQLAQVSTELKNVQDERDRLAESLARAENDVENTRSIMAEHVGKNTSEAELRGVLEREIEHLKSSLINAHKEMNESRQMDAQRVAELESSIEKIAAENDSLLKEKTNLSTSLHELNEQIDQQAQRENNMEQERSSLREQLAESLQQLSLTTDKLGERESEMENLQEKLSQLEDLANEQNERAIILEKELEGIQSVHQTRSIETDGMKSQLDAANKRVSELLAQLEEHENIRDQIQEQHTQQSIEIEDLKDKLSHQISLHSSKIQEINDEANSTIDDLRGAYEEIEKRALQLEKVKSKLSDEISDLQHQLLTEQSRVIQINEQNEELKEINNSSIKEIDNLKSEIENIEKKNSELANSVQKLEEEVEFRESKVKLLSESKENLDRELKSLISEIGDGARSAHELEQSKRSLESQVSVLKRQVEEERNAKVAAEEIKRRWEEQQEEFRKRVEAEVDAKSLVIEESRKLLLEEINALGEKLDEESAARAEAQLRVARLNEEIESLKDLAEVAERSVGEEKDTIIQNLQSDLLKERVKVEVNAKALQDYEALATRHEQKSNNLQSKTEKLELELDAATRAKKQLERKVEEITAEAGFHLDSRNKLEAKNLVLQKEMNQLQGFIKEKDEKIAELEHELSQHTNELVSMRSIAKESTEAKEAINASVEQLEETISSLKAALRVSQQDVQSKEAELNELDVSFGNLQSELMGAHASISELQAERDLKSSIIEDIGQQLEEEKKKTEQIAEHEQVLIQSFTDLQDKVNDAMSFADKYESRAIKSEKMLLESKKKLEDVISASNESIKARDLAEAELQESKQRVLELENQIESLSMELAESKTVQEHLIKEIDAVTEKHKLDVSDHDSILENLRSKYGLELDNLSKDLDSTNQDYLALREAYISLDSTVVAKTKELEKIEMQNKELSKELSHAISKLEEIAPAYENARDAAKASESQVGSLKLEMDSLQLRSDALESAYNELVLTKEKLESRIDEVQSKYIEASNSRQTAEKAALQLEDELKGVKSKLSEVNELVSNLEKRSLALEAVALDSQAALEREREANTILTKQNNSLERSLKDSRHQIIDYEAQLMQTASRESKRFKDVDSGVSAKVIAEAKQSTFQQAFVKKLERQIRELQFQIEERDKAKARQSSELNRVAGKVKSLEKTIDELEVQTDQLNIEKRKSERMLEEARNLSNRLMRELETLRPKTSVR
ncbi:hypothetical protein BB559_002021 [Furculomyces boomerangus]|uniref:Myosin motor domain-containing protein n=1 Tax=Furculomyces boomerangus TaxID=61424 RepID=A0A2T9YYQ2_9FUNG|nr:hypothetical protein BB559_002021 [Furculomyces boomerangus]